MILDLSGGLLLTGLAMTLAAFVGVVAIKDPARLAVVRALVLPPPLYLIALGLVVGSFDPASSTAMKDGEFFLGLAALVGATFATVALLASGIRALPCLLRAEPH